MSRFGLFAFLVTSALIAPGLANSAFAACPAVTTVTGATDLGISFMNGTTKRVSDATTAGTSEGVIVYDSTNDTLRICNGTTWLSVSTGAGGGGSPGGTADGQIQYKSGTAFAASASLAWDATNSVLASSRAMSIGPSNQSPINIQGNLNRAYFIGRNATWDSGDDQLEFEATGSGSMINFGTGAISLHAAPSGTAGFPFSSNSALLVDLNGVYATDINSGTRSLVAAFEVFSTSRGFLPPRLTTAQVTAIATPPNGLMAYDTDTNTIKLRANGAWVSLATGVGGSGDVVGPASSTDNAVTRFDGTTGKLIQNSAVTVDDSGVIAASSALLANGANIGTNVILPTQRMRLGVGTASGPSGGYVAKNLYFVGGDGWYHTASGAASVLELLDGSVRMSAYPTGTADTLVGTGTDLVLNSNGLVLPGNSATTIAGLTTAGNGSLLYDNTNHILKMRANGAWVTVGGSSTPAANSLDFTEFKNAMALDATTTIAGGNAYGLTLTSDLTAARTTPLMTLSQANNATYENTSTDGLLLRLSNSDSNSSGYVAKIDTSGVNVGGLTFSNAGNATATPAVNISSWGNTAKVIDINVAPTSGQIININSSISGGVSAFTGDYIKVSSVFTKTSVGTTTDTGNMLDLSRANIMNNAGGTYAIAGDLAVLESNPSQTAGTLTDTSSILKVIQSYTGATGDAMRVVNAGAGNSFVVYDQATDTTPFVIDGVGNVGLGTATVDASALLQLTSTTQGLRLPNLTTTQVTAVSSPGEGLIVYDTDTDTIKLRANGAWVSVGGAGAGALTVTSSSANALAVGPNGATNPTFQVDASASSAATGIKVTSSAAGSGVSIGAISSDPIEQLTLMSKGGGRINFDLNGTNRLVLADSWTSFVAGSSGLASTRRFGFTGAADTGLTASTEATSVHFNIGQTREHATGALSLQRDFRITPSTHSFVGGSTLTRAAALSVDGAPAGGTNATITTSTGIDVPTKALTGVTNGYGLTIVAPTGATNNYAAAFDGSVGIGTTAPAYGLDVTGTVRAAAYLYTSDRRLKDNIETLDGLDIVSRLHGVSFNWKKDGKRATGVIAQEVEAVLPDAVATDDKGVKAVDYQQLIGPMIEAIKTLKTENEALKIRLDALEGASAAAKPGQ